MLEKILVDSVDYKVEYTDEVILVDGRHCIADIDYNTSKIRLSNEIKDAGREARVLFHELVHAILYERGMDEERKNENLVDELAAGIVNLIRHNPDLVSYITKK